MCNFGAGQVVYSDLSEQPPAVTKNDGMTVVRVKPNNRVAGPEDQTNEPKEAITLDSREKRQISVIILYGFLKILIIATLKDEKKCKYPFFSVALPKKIS